MLAQRIGAAVGMPIPHRYFGERILELAHRLARWSETPDGLTCTYFSPAHKAVAAELRAEMQAAGMTASIDAVGNVVGRYPSSAAAAKTLIVGSHYDTVANAGQFDGRLGILTGLVVVEFLHRAGRRLPFHIDLIGFAEEEGVRFSEPYLGSAVVAGGFEDSILARRDAAGLTLGQLLENDNVDLAAIRALKRAADTLCGYVEVHIEQGPVLLERGLPVGVVSAIAGSARYYVTVHGTTGHAGTVPMPLRRDAAAAAAEMILAVERRCANNGTLVGTVGQVMVPQGLINVIPGRCEFSVDIRAGDDATRDAAIIDISTSILKIAGRRGVTAEIVEIGRHAAVPCAASMQSALARSVARAGIEPFHLPSGAGHDAAMFAGVTAIGMLFVRCGNGGLSHSPLETVTAEDADIGAAILLDFILSLT